MKYVYDIEILMDNMSSYFNQGLNVFFVLTSETRGHIVLESYYTQENTVYKTLTCLLIDHLKERNY